MIFKILRSQTTCISVIPLPNLYQENSATQQNPNIEYVTEPSLMNLMWSGLTHFTDCFFSWLSTCWKNDIAWSKISWCLKNLYYGKCWSSGSKSDCRSRGPWFESNTGLTCELVPWEDCVSASLIFLGAIGWRRMLDAHKTRSEIQIK